MMPARPEPRFFLDRGLGSHLVPSGLRDRGWHVTTMDERYGPTASQSVADTDWIRDASERGECLLTKDAAIAKNSTEADIIYNCDARVFTITDARITGPEILARFVRYEADIFRWAARVQPPFVLGLGAVESRRLKLNRP
ncbi:hypothetical protein V2J52_00515 [Georgenia sp. MJ173]|uniref:PIN-like domain-containing protein n=1 Tax=Georgenia sunbinii TaxID=3117728 RepID=UPI002F264BEA